MSGRGNDGTLFVSGGGSSAKDAENSYAYIMLSSDDYLRVQRLVEAGENVEMEADVKTKFYDKDIKGYNVIAEIPGTDPVLKDEIVMLGGHLDSWQGATGATDNAAGCAVMMEALRIIKVAGFTTKKNDTDCTMGRRRTGFARIEGICKDTFCRSGRYGFKSRT